VKLLTVTNAGTLWPRATLTYRNMIVLLISPSPADHTKLISFTSMLDIWLVKSDELTMLSMLMVNHLYDVFVY